MDDEDLQYLRDIYDVYGIEVLSAAIGLVEVMDRLEQIMARLADTSRIRPYPVLLQALGRLYLEQTACAEVVEYLKDMHMRLHRTRLDLEHYHRQSS